MKTRVRENARKQKRERRDTEKRRSIETNGNKNKNSITEDVSCDEQANPKRSVVGLIILIIDTGVL